MEQRWGKSPWVFRTLGADSAWVCLWTRGRCWGYRARVWAEGAFGTRRTQSLPNLPGHRSSGPGLMGRRPRLGPHPDPLLLTMEGMVWALDLLQL